MGYKYGCPEDSRAGLHMLRAPPSDNDMMWEPHLAGHCITQVIEETSPSSRDIMPGVRRMSGLYDSGCLHNYMLPQSGATNQDAALIYLKQVGI